MLGLVARYADEWNMWSVPAELQARAEVLDAACERTGRDPATIWRSTQAPVLVTNDPVRAEDFRARIPGRAGIAGSVEQVAAAIAEYAEVGIDEFIIPDVAWADGPSSSPLSTSSSTSSTAADGRRYGRRLARSR